MGNVNLFAKSLAIVAVTFGLMACNGGSDSEDLVSEANPGVSVNGLASGDSVTVSASFSSNNLTFNGDATRSFDQELLDSESYQLSLSVNGASNCAFSANRENNLESSDPTTTDQILCNEQLQSANQGDEELEANSIGLAMTDAAGDDVGTAANPVTGSTDAEATATVVGPDGNPVEQKAVEFSLQGQGSIGVLDPTSGSAVTDGTGAASITVTAGDQTGANTLVATAEVDGQQLDQSIDFQVNAGTSGGGGAVDQLSMALNLTDGAGNPIGGADNPITGSTPGVITATVSDASGNSVPDAVVEFTTSLGTIDSTNGAALTDSNGDAKIALEVADESGAGTVTATVEVDGQLVEESVNFQANAGSTGAANTLQLSLMNGGNPVGTSGNPITEAKPGTIGATVIGPDGNPVEGTAVSFDTTIGQLDPASGSALTDGAGVANITLESGGDTGAGTITATTEVEGVQIQQTRDFQVESAAGGTNPTVSLDITDGVGNSLGGVGSPITATEPGVVTATVEDASGNPISDEIVSFTTSLGTIDATNGTALTNGSGAAEITLEVADESGAGTLTAAVEVDGQQVEETINFQANAGSGAPADTIQLSLTDGSGNTVGVSGNPITEIKPGIISAEVIGPDGNPVEGTAVSFDTTRGQLDPGSGSALTSGAGVANITLESGGDTGAGTITATAEVEGTQIQGTLGFKVDTQTSIKLQVLDTGGNAFGTSTNPITESVSGNARATVIDPDGNPIQGKKVTFQTTNSVGALSPDTGTALTDSNGVAEVTLEAGDQAGAGTLIATITVQGQDLDDSRDYEVALGAGGPGAGEPSASLNITDAVGNPLGDVNNPITESTPGRVTATVEDADNNGVPGKVVSFQTTLGTLDPATGTALTGSNGEAVITLNAGSTAGAGTITATANVEDQEVQGSTGFQAEASDPAGAGVDLALGSGSGGGFQEGQLELSTQTTEVGSTVNVTASVVDRNNGDQLSSEVVELQFTSACVGSGNAEIDSPVNTVSGTASVAYTPQQDCTRDVIEASANLGGTLETAQSSELTIAQAPPKSISFEGADPSIIGLKGAAEAGISETSTLEFLVKDTNGNAVGSGIQVNLTTQTGVGGFAITSGATGTTNSNGVVTVVVQSGSVPGVGTVVAALDTNPDITGAGSVSIQGGVASQERFSMALDTINPAAGNDFGKTVEVSLRAADRWGNWVPEGTRINLTTELGDIESSCKTTDGGCSVTWTSQGPDSQNHDAQRTSRSCFTGGGTEVEAQGLPGVLTCSVFDRFGRSTILAYAAGEEAFDDEDGDNQYDDGETVTQLPEAFRDDNETGEYENAPTGYVEEFINSVNESAGNYNGADSEFQGVGCDNSTDCQNNDLADVRDSTVLVLSTDAVEARLFAEGTDLTSGFTWHQPGDPTSPPAQWGNVAFSGADVSGVDTTDYDLTGTRLNEFIELTPGDNNRSFSIHLADANGNAPPAGTTASVSGGPFTVFGPESCEVANTTEPVECSFSLAIPSFGDPTNPPAAEPVEVTIDSAGGPTATSTLGVSFAAPPRAFDDSATLDENTSETVDVLANDNDPDGTLDPATVTVTSAPSNGSFSVNSTTGEVTYTPDTDYTGDDTFDYEVTDDQGASASATVDLTVEAVP